MNINNPFTLRWTKPDFRTDGVRIAGAVSYIVDIKAANGEVVFSANAATNSITITPLNVPLRPGKYKATVKTIEDTIEESTTSAKSDPYTFTLESVADPLPPTGVTI